MLVLDVLVDGRACKTLRLTRVVLVFAAGGITTESGLDASNKRLPLSFVTGGILEGAFTTAFCVGFF